MEHPDPIVVYDTEKKEIFRLRRDGTIVYKDREVESDDELREAVTLLVKRLTPND